MIFNISRSYESKATFSAGDETKEFAGFTVNTEVKLKKKCAKGRFEAKFAPTDVKLEKEIFPPEANKDGVVTSVLGRVEHTIGKDRPNLTLGFTHGAPKLHDSVGLWIQAYLTYTAAKDFKGDFAGMLGFQDKFFVGSKVIGDLKTRKADKIHGIAGAKFDGNFVYFGANCLEHVVRLGFSTPHVQYLSKLAAEAQVSLNEKGSFQDKTTCKAALEHQLNSDSKLKLRFDVTKKLMMHFSFSHKINSNLKFTFADSCNPIAFFKNPAAEKYRYGLAFGGTF